MLTVSTVSDWGLGAATADESPTSFTTVCGPALALHGWGIADVSVGITGREMLEEDNDALCFCLCWDFGHCSRRWFLLSISHKGFTTSLWSFPRMIGCSSGRSGLVWLHCGRMCGYRDSWCITAGFIDRTGAPLSLLGADNFDVPGMSSKGLVVLALLPLLLPLRKGFAHLELLIHASRGSRPVDGP